MLKIKVDGYQQAKEALDQMSNNLQKRVLRSALKSSAKPMLKSAQSKVPVRSGKLKEQLKTVSFRDRGAPRSEVSVAVKPVFSRNKKKGTVNEYYGKFVHEGTKDPRTARKGKIMVFENAQGEKVFTRSTKGLKANPFLEKAYTESNSRTVEIFGDELGKAVTRFVRGNFKPVK